MTDIALSLTAFAVGVVITILVVLRIGSGLEDRTATLRGTPPTRAAAAARRMTGLYARTPQLPDARQEENSDRGTLNQ